jgi:hypothetical protein
LDETVSGMWPPVNEFFRTAASQQAGVLEAAATRLRTGQDWDEGTTGDLLREILRVYPAHVKKALALALLSGKF